MQALFKSAQSATGTTSRAHKLETLIAICKRFGCQPFGSCISMTGYYIEFLEYVCEIIIIEDAYHLVPKVLAYEKARMTNHYAASNLVKKSHELANVCNALPYSSQPESRSVAGHELREMISIVAFYYVISLAKSPKDIAHAKKNCYIFTIHNPMFRDIIGQVNSSLRDTKHACIAAIFRFYRDTFEAYIPEAMKPRTIINGLEHLSAMADAYRSRNKETLERLVKDAECNILWHVVIK